MHPTFLNLNLEAGAGSSTAGKSTPTCGRSLEREICWKTATNLCLTLTENQLTEKNGDVGINLYTGMLIGKKMKIVDSKDPSLSGRSGTIVLESKNMISFRDGERMVTVPKSIVRLSLKRMGEPDLLLDGSELLATPEDRIKS